MHDFRYTGGDMEGKWMNVEDRLPAADMHVKRFLIVTASGVNTGWFFSEEYNKGLSDGSNQSEPRGWYDDGGRKINVLYWLDMPS